MGIIRVSACYIKSIIDAQFVRPVFDRMMIPQQDPTTRTQWINISDVQIKPHGNWIVNPALIK